MQLFYKRSFFTSAAFTVCVCNFLAKGNWRKIIVKLYFRYSRFYYWRFWLFADQKTGVSANENEKT